LARQINKELKGCRIASGNQGNTPHKFIWYSRSAKEYAEILSGRTVTGAKGKGNWLFISLDAGWVLAMGDMGGRVVLYDSEDDLPRKYHLLVRFDDGRCLAVSVQGWGFLNLFTKNEVSKHKYAGNIGLSPLSKAFTYDRFRKILDRVSDQEKLVVKKLIVSDPRFPGISNGYLQDILFHAGIHHTRRVVDIKGRERQKLYHAIRKVLKEATDKGGKDEERDLYNEPGGYSRILNAKARGKPCPVCGAAIDKIQFLGGASYFCPNCQT
jgi:formamidopyrimidine-DNA glycosylase